MKTNGSGSVAPYTRAGLHLAGLLALGTAAARAQDFNGDLYDDVAIGNPSEDLGGVVDCGAVTVIYGDAAVGLNADLGAGAVLPGQLLSQTAYGIELDEGGDHFGAALAWGDFNGDGYDDLAVGVPGEDTPGGAAAGLVIIFHGSTAGLSPAAPALIGQGPFGLPDPDESGDALGSALGSGSFNGDAFDDLAIGVPGEDGPGGVPVDMGLVHQVGGTPGGLFPGVAPIEVITPGPPFFVDPPEAGDAFGSALAVGDYDDNDADDLAIGVPLEDVGADVDAGMVNVAYATFGFGLDPGSFTPPEDWTQDSPLVADSAEPGDLFGCALAAGDFDANGKDDLAIGIMMEDIGVNPDCGAVAVLYGDFAGIGLDAASVLPDEFWHQNSVGIPDANQPSDLFGAALAAGDFNGDFIVELAIGVPGEDIGAGPVVDCGAVNTIYSSGFGFGLDTVAPPVPAEFWNQNTGGVAEVNGAGDLFGSSLTVGDFDFNVHDDLAIGVPGEDIGAIPDTGCVITLYGDAFATGLDSAFPVPSELWHQGTLGVPDVNEVGDTFGDTLDNDD